jgi:hypothetical protein
VTGRVIGNIFHVRLWHVFLFLHHQRRRSYTGRNKGNEDGLLALLPSCGAPI